MDAMDVDMPGGTMEVDLHDETEQTRPQEHVPFNRRRSMSEEEERSRRASIKAILADNTITPTERRRSIQHLMDGRRSSIGTSSVASTSSVGSEPDNEYGNNHQYGYGDSNSDIQQQGQLSHGTLFLSEGEQCIPIANENTKRAEQTRPHCDHYVRNCTLITPCCGAAFGCRICHDESPVLPPLLMMKQTRRYPRSSSLPGSFTTMLQTPEETHHQVDRFAVKEVICRECFTKQSSKT
jgi:CHY zinc finger